VSRSRSTNLRVPLEHRRAAGPRHDGHVHHRACAERGVPRRRALTVESERAPEKQLNSQGLSSGQSGRKKLRGAQYIFEGAITEANSGEKQNSSAVGIAGMSVTGGSNADAISVDVRIVDAENGDVLDSVTVRKTIKSASKGVSGIGNLIGTVLSRRHVDTTYAPDVNVQQQRKRASAWRCARRSTKRSTRLPHAFDVARR